MGFGSLSRNMAEPFKGLGVVRTTGTAFTLYAINFIKTVSLLSTQLS